MTKNGFEIRLEVLKMAKEMLDQQYMETSNLYWTNVNKLAEQWNKSAVELIEQTQSFKPMMYTPQELAEKAAELYKFVSTKE